MPERTVNPRHLPFLLAVPINTTSAAPLSQSIASPLTELVAVHLIVPRGHAGLTGFRLRMNGVTILPFTSGNDWITADGLDRDFDLGGLQIDTVQVQGYNTDAVYTHTFYGELFVRDIPAPPPSASPVALVPVAAAAVSS